MVNKDYEPYETGEMCPNCGKPLKEGKLPPYGKIVSLTCECVINAIKEERIKNIQRGNEVIRQHMLKKSNLKSRWLDKSFENFEVKRGQEEAFGIAKNFADGFHDGSTEYKNGIIFVGATGCGKTHLATSIIHTIIQKMPIFENEAENAGQYNRYDGNIKCPAKFSTTIELLSKLKAAYSSGDSASDIITEYKTAPLIVLDDFGAEKQSEWVAERLFEIIDWRYSDNLPIIVTTNATPNEIKISMGARIYDRLKEMCKFVFIDTNSQRKAVE